MQKMQKSRQTGRAGRQVETTWLLGFFCGSSFRSATNIRELLLHISQWVNQFYKSGRIFLCTILFLISQKQYFFHYFFKRIITQGHKCLLTLSTSFGKHFAHNAFGAGYFQAEQKFPKCSACWWYGGGAYYFKLGFRQEKIKLLLQSICCALPDLINRKEIVDMLVLFVCTKNISR